ncbi:FAD synthetase [[Bacillus] enclensis]|jgi:riboflavin kinase / FMN adenylyltransferase|uniref:FAD synthase n=1 Tax=[Bacillus] enclensis TaxID=1402860 RepID=A0A0V8HMG8_9BACI|nr:FAD synthetase [[Bacillus] enclensis]KSU63329.1 FAD synthetase [[Bacillus] enclensis]OAT83889.1 FAD synthetase [Bacillus sp. MKU004]SCB81997.1 riboflavin kinase/FMN adenylyltransferase [[Bacillus] enclensis]
MEAHVYSSLELPGSVVAIGAFDGVHRGHQAVIRQSVQRSRKLKVPSVVYTFDPPPRVFFQGAKMLTTVDEKLWKLKKLGVQHTVVTQFDEVYAKKSASEFIHSLEKLNPVEIMVGGDFRFGKDRIGDISLLEKYFKVSVTKPVLCSQGSIISSTRIRQLISEGEVNLSNALLGWDFSPAFNADFTNNHILQE